MKLATFSQILVIVMAAASSQAAGREASAATSQPQVTPASVLETLDKSHPRLMLKHADLAELKKRIDADPLLAKCRDDLLKKADGYCRQQPVAYKLIGPRLLQVSRDCMNRVYALGLAWATDGQAGLRGQSQGEPAGCLRVPPTGTRHTFWTPRR